MNERQIRRTLANWPSVFMDFPAQYRSDRQIDDYLQRKYEREVREMKQIESVLQSVLEQLQ